MYIFLYLITMMFQTDVLRDIEPQILYLFHPVQLLVVKQNGKIYIVETNIKDNLSGFFNI